MERKHSIDIDPEKDKTVKIAGWVHEIRDMGSLKFVIVRDREGLSQVAIKKTDVSPEILKISKDLGKEDVVEVQGKTKADARALNGFEIIPEKIDVLSKAGTPLPLDTSGKIESQESKRFDYRFIDLRDLKKRAIFKVRDRILYYTREFLGREGFIEIHTPKIVAEGAEGGSDLFPIVYYNREAYLNQSPQFYKQIMQAAGFEKVYEIGPVYRAEKSHTIRHLSEFISIDFEMSFIESMDDIMKVEEKLVYHILSNVVQDCKKDFEILEITPSVPKIPFPRVTMREAYKLLEENGKKIPYGEELDSEGEKMLGEIVKKKFGHEFVFLTQFPFKVKPFYVMKNKNEPEWAESFDLLWNGLEITTGGQREHRYDILTKQAQEKKVGLTGINSYLESFKYGMPPHGGLGIGLERIVMLLLGLKNVREACLFPRDVERLTP